MSNFFLSCMPAQSLTHGFDPMDYNPPGSFIRGVLQARILEWIAISFSRGSSQIRNQTHVSCIAGGFSLPLLLLSRFRHVRLCVTPETAAHQAPLSLGFSRQEHWTGLPFPSPMHESEKWKGSRSVVSDSSQPHGLQPTRLLFQARVLEWSAIAFS